MPVDRCIERVDLFFAAKGLPKLHTFNTTDPFAVLYYLHPGSNKLEKIGFTVRYLREILKIFDFYLLIFLCSGINFRYFESYLG